MNHRANFTCKSRIRFYFCVLAVAGAVSLVFLVFSPFQTSSFIAPQEISKVVVMPQEQYEEQKPGEWIPELPVRLVIPAINVEAEVQYVGLALEGTGEMDVPSNFTDVGWYKHGVRPGMRGSAVIAGHYNGKNVPEAVFFDLDALQVGDEVVVMSAERIEDIFQVVKIASYEHDAPTTEVFVSTDGKKRLNLITCGGVWLPEERLYDKRTVVFTELMTDVE